MPTLEQVQIASIFAAEVRHLQGCIDCERAPGVKRRMIRSWAESWERLPGVSKMYHRGKPRLSSGRKLRISASKTGKYNQQIYRQVDGMNLDVMTRWKDAYDTLKAQQQGVLME
eukprot:jgi/Bigna1/140782/aug1.58_g15490